MKKLPALPDAETLNELAEISRRYSNLDLEDAQALVFAARIWSIYRDDEIGMIERKSEIEKIDDLAQALKTAVRTPLDPVVEGLLRHKASSRLSIDVRIDGVHSREPSGPLGNPLFRLRVAAAALLPLLEEVREHVRDGLNSSRKNYEGMKAARACRNVWNDLTSLDPPSTLGENAPMTQFLEDVLRALGVDANPRSAYETWMSETHKNPDTQISIQEDI